MPSDISLTVGGHLFNSRVAAIVIEEGHVLTCRFGGAHWRFLPGGRVAAGESSVEALQRELREKPGEGGTVVRPVFFTENFFELDGRHFHEIGTYFLVDLPGAPREPHVLREVGRDLHFEWVALGDLPTGTLEPAGLRGRLAQLPAQPEHLVFRS